MKLLKWFAVWMVAAVLAGCGGGGDDSSPPTSASVTYTVTGGGSILDVTYRTPNGQAQRSGTAFTETFIAHPGDFLYVSGQTNGSTNFASVTATIKIDGVTFKTITSTGPFVIATASGSCC